jgi:hypothetical protein
MGPASTPMLCAGAGVCPPASVSKTRETRQLALCMAVPSAAAPVALRRRCLGFVKSADPGFANPRGFSQVVVNQRLAGGTLSRFRWSLALHSRRKIWCQSDLRFSNIQNSHGSNEVREVSEVVDCTETRPLVITPWRAMIHISVQVCVQIGDPLPLLPLPEGARHGLKSEPKRIDTLLS